MVLQNAYKAVFGNVSLQDVTLTGSAHRIAGSDDESGSVVLKAVPSGSMKLSLSFSSGNLTEVRENSGFGLVGAATGTDGVSKPIPYQNLIADPGLFPAFTISRLVNSPNFVSTYLGQETRNGTSVIHLSVYQQTPMASKSAAALPQRLSQMEIYLDATSFLPIAATFNTHRDLDALVDIPVEIDYSDYRSVKGVLVPFHVEKSVNYSPALDLQFDTVNFNTGITASEFNIQ